MDKAGRRLAGHKGAVDEAGEAVVIVKTKKVKEPKAVTTYVVGEAEPGKKGHKGRRLAGHKGAVDEVGEAVVVVKTKMVKAPKAPKHVMMAEADDGEAIMVGKKHGKHLLGGHGAMMAEADDGEAMVKVKAPKVHKVRVPKAPKVKAPKVVYVDEAGEAGGKKHKGGR
jgi:hypothetical protein